MTGPTPWLIVAAVFLAGFSIGWGAHQPPTERAPRTTTTTTTTTTVPLGGVQCGPARVDPAMVPKLGCP